MVYLFALSYTNKSCVHFSVGASPVDWAFGSMSNIYYLVFLLSVGYIN